MVNSLRKFLESNEIDTHKHSFELWIRENQVLVVPYDIKYTGWRVFHYCSIFDLPENHGLESGEYHLYKDDSGALPHNDFLFQNE